MSANIENVKAQVIEELEQVIEKDKQVQVSRPVVLGGWIGRCARAGDVIGSHTMLGVPCSNVRSAPYVTGGRDGRGGRRRRGAREGGPAVRRPAHPGARR